MKEIHGQLGRIIAILEVIAHDPPKRRGVRGQKAHGARRNS